MYHFPSPKANNQKLLRKPYHSLTKCIDAEGYSALYGVFFSLHAHTKGAISE